MVKYQNGIIEIEGRNGYIKYGKSDGLISFGGREFGVAEEKVGLKTELFKFLLDCFTDLAQVYEEVVELGIDGSFKIEVRQENMKKVYGGKLVESVHFNNFAFIERNKCVVRYGGLEFYERLTEAEAKLMVRRLLYSGRVTVDEDLAVWSQDGMVLNLGTQDGEVLLTVNSNGYEFWYKLFWGRTINDQVFRTWMETLLIGNSELNVINQGSYYEIGTDNFKLIYYPGNVLLSSFEYRFGDLEIDIMADQITVLKTNKNRIQIYVVAPNDRVQFAMGVRSVVSFIFGRA